MRTASTSAGPRHPIQVVSRRTHLSADVLRAWERRYQAVLPKRSPSGRRLYSDAEIARLVLLRKATAVGRSIGQVAGMPARELAELVAADAAAEGHPITPLPTLADPHRPEEYVRLAVGAVEQLDAQALRDVLVAAGLAIGPTATIERVLIPVLESMTDTWADEYLSMALEHLAPAMGQMLRDRNARH